LKKFIIYGETDESENNLVVFSFEEARDHKSAFNKWLNSDTFRAQKDIITEPTEIRVQEVIGDVKFFYINQKF